MPNNLKTEKTSPLRNTHVLWRWHPTTVNAMEYSIAPNAPTKDAYITLEIKHVCLPNLTTSLNLNAMIKEYSMT